MKIHHLQLFLPMTILMLSCGDNQQRASFKKFEIWENIRIATKEKRVDYLLKISKDTLECIECNNGKSRIAKADFFKNYLSQIEISDTKQYGIYSEKYEEEKGFNRRHRINYAYEGIGKHKNNNTIYTILTGEDSIQFQGVFSVP